MTFPKFTQAQLENFVRLLNQRSKHSAKGANHHEYVTEYRTKFVRIMMYRVDGTGKRTNDSGSVHCFIDADGSILKAASLNKPAKGVRGSILAADPLAGTNEYGAEYLR